MWVFFKTFNYIFLDAVPGGCGVSHSNNFSVSTIVTHWDSLTDRQFDQVSNSSESETYDSSKMLNFWTSTVNFYAASEQTNLSDSCSDTFFPNATFLENIVYHVYHVPLVICGSSAETYSNPTTADVLKSLSSVSSSGDTLFRGSLVTSISGK